LPGLNPANETLPLPDFAAYGVSELARSFQGRGIMFRVYPVSTPDFARPIEAVHAIGPHPLAPGLNLQLKR
jgi:hypothetical protein